MRTILFLLAILALAGTGTAWACPMQQSASNDQVVANSGDQAPSTPIPPRSEDGNS
ncbi:MAG: hypothetical protein U1E17_10800 [Geminicoccaceae bacterium]